MVNSAIECLCCHLALSITANATNTGEYYSLIVIDLLVNQNLAASAKTSRIIEPTSSYSKPELLWTIRNFIDRISTFS